jgi:bla regulator protein blaR1
MSSALQLAEHPLVNAIGWTLLHFVWQGAVIGLITYLILRVVRPTLASTRYLFGVAALGVILVAPIVTFVSVVQDGPRVPTVSWPAAPAASPSALVTGSIIAEMAANPAATRQFLPPGGSTLRADGDSSAAPYWLPILTALWFIGVLGLSMRMLGGWVMTRLLARRAVARVSPVIEAAARDIATRLDLQRAVAILESAAVTVPTLIGWVRPVVLLPAAALSGLSPLQLQAILAHELAHVRRHDYLVNLLQSAVEILLFYHPAVWWISAEIRAERENCCDDLAIAVCGHRRLARDPSASNSWSSRCHAARAAAVVGNSDVGRAAWRWCQHL